MLIKESLAPGDCHPVPMCDSWSDSLVTLSHSVS